MGPFDSQTLRGVRIAGWPGRLSWPTRLAAGAALLTVALVALLLIVPALFVGGLVLLVGSAVAGVRRRLAARFDGRRNVRVIVRDER